MSSKVTPLAVILIVAILIGPVCADEIPSAVHSALAANVEATLDGLMIEGFQERRFLIHPSAGLKEIGTLETESEFTERVPFSLKLQGDKYYESSKHPADAYHSGTAISEHSFDGAKYYGGTSDPVKNKINPGILIIHSLKTHQKDAVRRAHLIFEFWYLGAAGFDGPRRGSDLGRPIQSLVLSRLAAGILVSCKTIPGKDRQLVEIVVRYPDPWMSRLPQNFTLDAKSLPLKPKSLALQMEVEKDRRDLTGATRECRFLLDSALNYAVREISEWRDPARIMFQTKCDDFIKIEGTNSWLPRHCDITSSASELRPTYVGERPIYVTSIQVQKIKRQMFEDDSFQIRYNFTGANVADYTHEKAADGRPFEYVVAASGEELEFGVRSAGRTRGWLIILNVSVVLLFVGVVWWKRVRSARSKS